MNRYIKNFLTNTTTRILGLDISSTSVKLVELSRSVKGFQVESLGVELLPENAVVEKNIRDIPGVGETIARLAGRCQTRVKTAAIAVAGSAVISKMIDTPVQHSDVAFEREIRAQAVQHIPFPMDEVALDFAVLGPSKRNVNQVEVLLVACRRETVEARAEALLKGGLKTAVVDIEAHCMQRAYRLLQEQTDICENHGAVAVIDIGATMTTLNLLSGTAVPETREELFGGKQLTEAIQRRYGLSVQEASQAKLRDDLPRDYETEVLQPFKEDVVQQITRSLQFVQSGSVHDSVQRIVLTGGTASISGLSDLVSARLGIPCSIANPFRNMSMSSGASTANLVNNASGMMIACGLALRSYEQ